MKKDKRIPQHKVGVRILIDQQVENIFPTYRSMLEKIEDYRKEVQEVSLEAGQETYQDYLMYDNVFGIFGQRGSGKSSTIFTIRDNIINSAKGDYALPIIMPDIIVMPEGIMGWLLAMLGDSIKDLKVKLGIKDEDYNSIFAQCKVKNKVSAIQELEMLYNELCEKAFSGKYSPGCSGDYFDSISDFTRQSRDEYNVTRLFVEFWNTFVKVLKELSNKKAPLIYVIFDDVDLSPHRVEEMVSTIMRYLSHPNVITIVTADEDELTKVLEKIYKEKMKVNDEICSFDEEERIANSAKAYLDKLFPPSNRYYLQLFDSVEKKATFIEKDKDSLQRLLENKIELYIKNTNQTNEYSRDFLHYEGKFLSFYLKIFGVTARQITNGYFTIEETIDNLTRIANSYNSDSVEIRHRLQTKIYYVIRRFIRNMINSNPNMAFTKRSEEMEKVCDNLFIFDYNGWPLYVNYGYLIKWYNAELEKADKQLKDNLYIRNERAIRKSVIDELYQNKLLEIRTSLAETTLCGFALCFFTESLLEILDRSKASLVKNRNAIHGYMELIKFIEIISEPKVKLIKAVDNVSQLLYTYEVAFEHLVDIINFNMMEYSCVYRYFTAVKGEGIIPNENKQGIATNKIMRLMQSDPVWFKSMVQMTFMYFGRYYLVNRQLLPNGTIQNLVMLNCGYINSVEGKLQYVIDEVIKTGNILQTADEYIVHWKKLRKRKKEIIWKKKAVELADKLLKGIALSELAEQLSDLNESDILGSVLQYLGIESKKEEEWMTVVRIQEIEDLIQRNIVIQEEKISTYQVKKNVTAVAELQKISKDVEEKLKKFTQKEKMIVDKEEMVKVCGEIYKYIQNIVRQDVSLRNFTARTKIGDYSNYYAELLGSIDYYVKADKLEDGIVFVLLLKALVIIQKYSLYMKISEKNKRIGIGQEERENIYFQFYCSLREIVESSQDTENEWENRTRLKRVIIPALDEVKEEYIKHIQRRKD